MDSTTRELLRASGLSSSDVRLIEDMAKHMQAECFKACQRVTELVPDHLRGFTVAVAYADLALALQNALQHVARDELRKLDNRA